MAIILCSACVVIYLWIPVKVLPADFRTFYVRSCGSTPPTNCNNEDKIFDLLEVNYIG